MLNEVQSQDSHQNLIVEIQNRIQFLVTIAIFFTVVLSYFFNIYDKSNANRVALSYVGVVAVYLLTYLCFEISRSKIKTNCLKIINIITFISIGTFLLPIIYLSLIVARPSTLLFIMQTLFQTSLYSLMIVPILLLVTILWSLVFYDKITFWRR